MKNKALTVKQPYAILEVQGIKDIENRTWKTSHRGRVYIHASGSHGKKFNVNLTDEQMIAAFGSIADEAVNGDFQFGAIIGHVDIVDCVENHPSIWALPNHYHWVLADPVLFDKPILNVKGKLSLWDCSNFLEEKRDL